MRTELWEGRNVELYWHLSERRDNQEWNSFPVELGVGGLEIVKLLFGLIPYWVIKLKFLSHNLFAWTVLEVHFIRVLGKFLFQIGKELDEVHEHCYATWVYRNANRWNFHMKIWEIGFTQNYLKEKICSILMDIQEKNHNFALGSFWRI